MTLIVHDHLCILCILHYLSRQKEFLHACTYISDKRDMVKDKASSWRAEQKNSFIQNWFKIFFRGVKTLAQTVYIWKKMLLFKNSALMRIILWGFYNIYIR